MLYERIFKEFHERRLRYAVIGGIAVNLHGYNRVTGDLDIIISLEPKNVQCFIEIVKGLHLEPKIPVALEELAESAKRQEWIETKNMKVFSIYNPQNPLEHIDVKIDGEGNIEKYLSRSEALQVDNFAISVVDIDSLIELKRQAGRERDLGDIRALEEIKGLK